ncbi:hypothetical protein VIGAN_02037400 [Vigna angularis var. angularis]|uniref:Uncharacterized protein n=1 Tax=Vigna angularis var. angularis TaxID=157739 RepID=A0A0S3RAW7_PHAAN|nr:hypothetical protein VIGAN_02037400 [Vigna angularis var. angularis]
MARTTSGGTITIHHPSLLRHTSALAPADRRFLHRSPQRQQMSSSLAQGCCYSHHPMAVGCGGRFFNLCFLWYQGKGNNIAN